MSGDSRSDDVDDDEDSDKLTVSETSDATELPPSSSSVIVGVSRANFNVITVLIYQY